jgi:uncharacterized protein (DUF924 family)
VRLPPRAEALLDLWFGPPGDSAREQKRAIWFEPEEAFDALLRANFRGDHEAAAAGALGAWEDDAVPALALVLLLDQIPRNIFRGTPRAYASDALARGVAGRALDRGFDSGLPAAWRMFFYLPFEHSEDLADQCRSLDLFASLPADGNPAENRRGARRHHEIIARFGRFPHRNAILGRRSSAAEREFLTEPDSSF